MAHAVEQRPAGSCRLGLRPPPLPDHRQSGREQRPAQRKWRDQGQIRLGLPHRRPWFSTFQAVHIHNVSRNPRVDGSNGASNRMTMSTPTSKPVVVLLSGGLDSTTAAYLARASGVAVHALSFDYGQRHRRELDAAARIAE